MAVNGIGIEKVAILFTSILKESRKKIELRITE